MSEVDDWMAAVDYKLDWLVEGMKALLTREAPVVAPEPPEEPDLPIAAPPSQNGSCAHQHQTLIGRDVCCAKCGHVIIANTGVYQRPVLQPE